VHPNGVTATTRTARWCAPLLLLSLLGIAFDAVGESLSLILEHVTAADGLPQATVMATLQDSKGFVWLGTEDGLVRFDGHELHRYAYSRADAGSLPGNFIWDIAEDARHDLWLAVKDVGLARWDRASDKFTLYQQDGRADSLASNAVRAVLVDAGNRIWVGTSDAGVDIVDPASGHVEHLRHLDEDAASLISNHVFTLAHARSGAIWIGTDVGLDRWDPRTAILTHFGAAGGRVSRVYEEAGGIVWVATFNQGLMRFDGKGRLLETFRHDARRMDSLQSDDVRAVLEDRAGSLWVGTADGLDLLDRSSGSFSHYRHDPNDTDSLRDSFVMSLYQDQSGLLWIGTRNGGVSRWNPRSWELGTHRPSWLGGGPVTAFADAPGNRVWVASLGGGLMQFDPERGVATSIDAIVGRRNALGSAHVMSLRSDHLGALWIGTMERGLQKLGTDGRLQPVAVKPGDGQSTSGAGIMTLYEARNGQIWIGTFGKGANVLDPATGVIRQLPYGNDVMGGVSGANVTAIVEDARGYFWLGTDGGGLNLARPDGSVIQVFRHDAHDATSLPANSIYALTVTADGTVWATTDGGGLVRIDGDPASPADIRFRALAHAEGLDDTLYGVVADPAGRLWVSGNAGLARVDPATAVIHAYHREHGLQGEEFAFGAFYRLRDGRLCFGGAGGFNIFDARALTEDRRPPRLAMSGYSVLGVPQRTAVPSWLLDRITLGYRDSVVSLDFAVLDFSSPKHSRLQYRMSGLTDQWIDLGTQRRITLTNLDAGNHRLQVRAASPDSEWSNPSLDIDIHRDAAPWRSRWAYSLYAALALGLILERTRRQRRKFRELGEARQRLESEVQLRTRELVDSNRQLAEAAQAKSNFLDRMSHELRTPMNGVVGMTELLSRTALSATQSHLTRTIRGSAQILLQIVNDLLDLSKIRAGKVALEALPLDLGQILEECTSLFAGAAEGKGIELIVCPPTRVGRALLGDPLRVRQILMNLIGNAVKFTSQGEVVVRAEVEIDSSDHALARISVSDTGIGMDAAALSRIFEPFSQADETTTRRFGGTGLGLSICRELADLMQGRISVESLPQIGSTFTLALPLSAGEAIAANQTPFLPSRRVRILTRLPALEDSLTRHLVNMGLEPLGGPAGDSGDSPETITVLDAGTYAEELQRALAATLSRTWVVIARAEQVESLQLRLLTDEKRIILKPLHRIALQEALAAAMGLQVAGVSAARAEAGGGETFRGHVLLVEDEPVNAAVAEGYLSALGCTSVWVKSGAESVARSAAERFDLIFMDLNMSDMDGFSATALIRQREAGKAHVPIVALTAHDAVSYRQKCLKAGMDAILSKPYSLADCATLLRQWLVHAPAAGKQTVTSVAPAVPAVSATPTVRVVPSATLVSIDSGAVNALRRLRANQHTDLYSRLVELFRTGSAESMAQLRDAFDAQNLTMAAAVCHKLAASAGNVGALEYARQLRRLEQLCVAGESSQVWALYQDLQDAHAPLMEALLGGLRASA
jgi:signal transduction histidine kinase/ligand-binding sensor domain-containing protein/CheY-like chemotaxis protein/HPt (histidine-containing phosphotransfer) domain-containing protein